MVPEDVREEAEKLKRSFVITATCTMYWTSLKFQIMNLTICTESL